MKTTEKDRRTDRPHPCSDEANRPNFGYYGATEQTPRHRITLAHLDEKDGGGAGMRIERDDKASLQIWRGENEQEIPLTVAAAALELLKACKFFMGALDDGDLVRNTARDHNSDWDLKGAKLVSELAKAQAAIAKAEGRE